MQQSLNIFKWYDNLWAALIFFTRLPFWRFYQPPKPSYAAVVEWWPLTGWLTGGVMAAVLFFGSMVLPFAVALLLAIVARLLLTGALHEDGLADFFDGFGGGGGDRERILAIMKDSHIGTYGVVALIGYFALLYAALWSLPHGVAPLVVMAADPFAKMVTSQLILMLPYARSEETAKNKTVYRHPGVKAGVLLALQGLLPMAVVYLLPLLPFRGPWSHVQGAVAAVQWPLVLFLPSLVMYFLYLLMAKRLRGYTGDCCGAVCLLVELTVYLVFCASLAGPAA